MKKSLGFLFFSERGKVCEAACASSYQSAFGTKDQIQILPFTRQFLSCKPFVVVKIYPKWTRKSIFISHPRPEELVRDEEDLDGLRLRRPEDVPLAVERLQRLVRQRLVKAVQCAHLQIWDIR